ncbi:sugar-binding transcriptional regulator [Propionicicella superfundia]|uniref:sugar-binding transcriptional regulator n=1 Tax=Propionicicella superfundia TaxID=348582 RepID=UPI0004148758|nr:sugar-binding domain-containing protein [Propionicicella superfundia]
MYASPARICHMYYGLSLTQQQIAEQLGVSRISVSRLLQQARADGIVQITIDFHGYYPRLEEALGALYPGCRFVVADPLDGGDEEVKESVAQTAAGVLTALVRASGTIAVGWGSTLKTLAAHVRGDLRGTTVVPLAGGQVHAEVDLHATTIAEGLARRVGARSARLFAPAVAASAQEREGLMRSRQVTDTMRLARSADVAVFSVGSPFSRTSTLHEVGYYTAAEIDHLRAARVECDIISAAYFDAQGRSCCEDLTARTVSLSAGELRAIPRKLCVAGGESKHLAVRLALEKGFCDVLVTDADTAECLLAAGRAEE